MARRFNRATGQYEEDDGAGRWMPVTDQQLQQQAGAAPHTEPQAVAPATMPPSAPGGFGGGSTANPEPSSYPGPFGEFGRMVRDRIQNSAWFDGGNRAVNDAGQPAPSGSVAGAAAGRAGANPPPPLNFGSGTLPEDQALIDALTGLQTALGTSPTITAPQLPEVPAAMFEADPGLQTLVDHATRRQGQVDQLIAELRSGREGDVNRTTNKWVTLGRWLSDWSATGDATQGGAAMARVLRENNDMREDLRRETLAYIQMGMTAEDAVVQAQAALLSGQAQARRELAAAQYGRSTQQVGLDFQASQANAEAAGRGATARANAAVTIAEAQRDIAARSREQRNRTAEIFSQDPRYSRQAFGEIAGNVTGDQRTADALTGVMSQQQESLALMNYIVSAQGSRDRTALQFLRQWDPTLNEDALRRSTPQALMMRLTQSPQSRGAFARNRDMLIRSMQFGGMQPAQ